MRSANVTVPLPTQRGLDAVYDLGMDPTGLEDCSQCLQTYLDNLAYEPDVELHFPPGRYYLRSGVVTNANRVKLVGDGQGSNITEGAVTLFSDQPLGSMLWFNCAKPQSNLQSVWLEHLQFEDTSPAHNQVTAAIRITNQANIRMIDVGGFNLVPRRTYVGTVTATPGSKTVEGSGTQWTSALMPGFIILGGYPYEIAAVSSPTRLTLAIAYQGRPLTGSNYAINTGGIWLWCDPGQSFTQYGQIEHLRGRNCGCIAYMQGGTGATGTSRIKFLSGYVNGAGLADCIAAYFGPFSDTMRWSVAANSWAFGVVIASGHMNDIISADFENAGGPPPVTGAAQSGYAACKGVLVMSDNASNTWGNRIVDCMLRQVGTAIEMVGDPTRSKLFANVFRSNQANCVLGAATETAGEIDGRFYGTNVREA